MTTGAVLRIGIVDTGVNAWHSHVRGRVRGCRLYAGAGGVIVEDGDYRDLTGHGTAVAGIVREAFPEAEIFAVRVFDAAADTWPSLVARGILRAALEPCAFINLSLGLPPGPGADALAAACAAAVAAGCVLAASSYPDRPDWLPASLPGVHAVTADDRLGPCEVRDDGSMRLRAPGRPRDLASTPRQANYYGASFACARGLVHLARQSLGDQRRAPLGRSRDGIR